MHHSQIIGRGLHDTVEILQTTFGLVVEFYDGSTMGNVEGVSERGGQE